MFFRPDIRFTVHHDVPLRAGLGFVVNEVFGLRDVRESNDIG